MVDAGNDKHDKSDSNVKTRGVWRGDNFLMAEVISSTLMAQQKENASLRGTQILHIRRLSFSLSQFKEFIFFST